MYRQPGDVVALRYITTDGRVEMAWPCRVVQDAAPPHEYTWRNDTLRLMFPGACHSVSLFWEASGATRRLLRYFVNMEEPFRRTEMGFDTQDHTLDVVVTPQLGFTWRDEAELESHVALGFYTHELRAAVRAEGERVIEAIAQGAHPCLQGWAQWSPDPRWQVPAIPRTWATAPATSWALRHWAYGSAP